MKNHRLVVVLGMHRSGTSAITRGLKVLGIELGDTLYGAMKGVNEKGFWEDIDLNSLDVEILDTLGSDWHYLAGIEWDDVEVLHKKGYFLRAVELLRQKINSVPIFGFKDPRVVMLMPFWKEVFGYLQLDVSYILAVRNPLSVVKSLAKRDDFEVEKSYILWLGHVIKSLTSSLGGKRVLVDYDLLMQSPEYELDRIAKQLDLAVDPIELKKYEMEFLDQDLRHSVYGLTDLSLDVACHPLVREIYVALLDVATDKVQIDAPEFQEMIKCWEGEFERNKSLLTLADKLCGQKIAIAQIASERDAQIAGLGQAVTEREGQVASLTKALIEREGQVASLTKALVEREGQVASLTKELVGRGGQIASLTKALVEREGQIASLTKTLVEQEGQIAASFTSSYSWRLTAPLRGFRSVLRKGALRLRGIQAHLLERKFSMDGFFDAEFYLKEYPDVANARIDPLHHYLEYGWREGRDPSPSFSTLLYLSNNPDVAIANMNPLLHYLHHGRIEGRMPFSRLIAESVSIPDQVPPVAGSTIQSDEMSGYFDAEFYLKEYPEVANARIDPLHHYLEYGWWEGRDPSPSFSTLLYLSNNPDVAIANMNPLLHYLHHGRIEGRMPFSRLKAAAESKPNQVPPVAGSTEVRHGDFLIPLYLNPFRPELTSGNPQIENVLICAIANDSQSYLSLLEALGNIPCKIDLQISVSDPAKIVHPSGQSGLDGRLRSLSIRDGSSDRSSLHALLAMVAKEADHPYDVIGFFDTTGGTLKPCAASAFSLLEAPEFSQTGVSEIMDTLAGDARIIVPALNWREHLRNARALDANLVNNVPDATLLGNATLAEHICECKSLWINGRSISVISQETWAHALAETSVSDSAIAVAEELAKIIKQSHGRDYVLFGATTNPPDPAYEEQIDYSGSIQSHGVKVLAFYLPQFNPTPENDEWHGEGFTEWHKVRAANPLFEGHYQQHVPHPDLGYYKLDSTEVLNKQAEMMKKAGVHGQIFYHYWFGGRLILEKAAQMLLADKTVDMPFCFCWANENWTRRWDGDEQEILLGQSYSPDDAAGFIRYLIPFFRDERYILIDGRPVLYIYRPSSIEHLAQYCTIWRDICREEGISEPFLVATLTRGANSPREFGMDAGCERVLHDWTGGEVCERRDELVAYRPVKGAVLNYDEVADFYMTHSDEKDFIYFRSIVPIWDNTSRYESRAYVVNSCSPEKFQEWLESLVLDATKRLKSSERFVVINAWNEWAEGAHLEPDCRYGYAYLNTVGRALSGFKYSKPEYLNYKIPKTTKLKLKISTDFLKRLTIAEWAKSKFIKCLENSSIWGELQVYVDVEVEEIMPSLSAVACTGTINTQYDYELIINDFCLFPTEAIGNMVKMAAFYGGCSITPTHINDPDFSHMETRWNTATEVSRYLYVRGFASPVLKYCVDADIFISGIDNAIISSPKVSTIVRFHKKGSLKLLMRALYSLAAQIDCRVKPIIAAQDLTPEMNLALDQMIEQIPWANDCLPMVRHYKSSDSIRDLRSLMLNDALSQISAGYVTFLDYDDIVYHDAYAWLANRLRFTGKNATFGRVYSTNYNPDTCRIGDKAEVFTYGAGYKCFIESNHAPIHSFMINIDKIEANNIEYYPDMKYMEDYFLTLQIFSEGGTDWESLNENKFVGEYYHQVGEDSPNTLALIDVEKKKSLLSDSYYLMCERRIGTLRHRIISKAQSDLTSMTFSWANRR